LSKVIAGIRIRPAWHIDLKWIFGLLFTAFLFETLLVFQIYRATKFETAKKVELAFLEAKLGARKELSRVYPTIRLAALKSPQSDLQLPNLPFVLSFKREEILQLEEKEFPQYVMEKLVKETYYKGFDVVFGKTASTGFNLVQGESFNNPLRIFFTFFSYRTNKLTKQILTVLGLATVIFFIPYFLFSSGFGKAISLGISTGLIGLPSYLLFSLAYKSASRGISSQGIEGKFKQDMLLPLNFAQKFYLWLLVLAIVLIVIGIAGNIWQRQRNKTKNQLWIRALDKF
jgi:hypothetical protein